MPFTMLFFFNGFIWLELYYFIANLTNIGQMLTIKRFFIDEEKIRAKIEDNKSKAKDRTKPSSWSTSRGRERSGEEAERNQRKKNDARASARRNDGLVRFQPCCGPSCVA